MWTTLELEGGRGEPVEVQEIPFYPAHWWKWEIRQGVKCIALSEQEALHFAKLVLGGASEQKTGKESAVRGVQSCGRIPTTCAELEQG